VRIAVNVVAGGAKRCRRVSSAARSNAIKYRRNGARVIAGAGVTECCSVSEREDGDLRRAAQSQQMLEQSFFGGFELD
jgi:hypothetical protein